MTHLLHTALPIASVAFAPWIVPGASPHLAALCRLVRRLGPALLVMLCCVVGFAGCSPSASAEDAEALVDAGIVEDAAAYQRADVSSPDAAPWPSATDTSLPGCAPWSDAWVLPDVTMAKLKHPKGSLELEASAVLQPIGEEETVRVSVRDAKGKQDAAAEGALNITTDPGIVVVTSQQVKGGTADVVLKVTKAGPHTLTATLADGRAGHIKLWGFKTQLPIWRVDADPADIATLYANPLEKIWIPATLTVAGETHTGKMRLHGGSSRTFSKKSFRLNLDKNQPLADGRRKLILRAEWVDKAMIRSYLAYEVVRHGTWLPASRLTYVHLRLGARYHGLMLHPDRVDKHILTDHNLNPNGSLYEADPPFEKSVPGGNLTVAKAAADYKVLYQHHEGTLNYVDLIELIEVVLQLPDAQFADNIDRVVKVDDVLVFLAMSAVIQNHDWVKKNYYLYRDPTATDSRWTIIPWDLDLSFGHLWTPEEDIFDEQIFTDGNPYVGMNIGQLFFNQLADRLFNVKRFRTRYRSFLAHLLEKTFDKAFLEPRMNNALCRMQPDMLADDGKRAKNQEVRSRVQEVRDFVVARRAWLTTWLKEDDPYAKK